MRPQSWRLLTAVSTCQWIEHCGRCQSQAGGPTLNTTDAARAAEIPCRRGNGFIGSAVCRAALRHGYQVTSIRLNLFRPRSPIRQSDNKGVPQLVRTTFPDPEGPHAHMDRKGRPLPPKVGCFPSKNSVCLDIVFLGAVAEGGRAPAGDIFPFTPWRLGCGAYSRHTLGRHQI